MDRFRDRWPMSMLVSRARLFNLDEKNKPRDVLAALRGGKGEGGVAILAEVSEVWMNRHTMVFNFPFPSRSYGIAMVGFTKHVGPTLVRRGYDPARCVRLN